LVEYYLQRKTFAIESLGGKSKGEWPKNPKTNHKILKSPTPDFSELGDNKGRGEYGEKKTGKHPSIKDKRNSRKSPGESGGVRRGKKNFVGIIGQ